MKKLVEVRIMRNHNQINVVRAAADSIGKALDFIAPDPAPNVDFIVTLVGEVMVDQSTTNAKPGFVMVTDEERERMIAKVVAATSINYTRAGTVVDNVLGCLEVIS